MSDMSFLELVPVLLTMYAWTNRLQYKKILLGIDNQALVSIVSKRRSKSNFVMGFLRPFVLLTMCNNVQYKVMLFKVFVANYLLHYLIFRWSVFAL